MIVSVRYIAAENEALREANKLNLTDLEGERAYAIDL